MTWLIWRQFRAQAWWALGVLAVLAVAYVISGPKLVNLYESSGAAACTVSCDEVIENFLRQVADGGNAMLFVAGIAILYGAPGLIGVFWGAPLVARELEAGTYRLVWNQSVTRFRWLAMKLVALGVATMALVGLFSLAVNWWAAPIDQASMQRLSPEIFGARGIVPIGYAAFAFVLGVAIGMVVRRTVPAMAVTLAIVVAVQVVMPLFVREHLLPPQRSSVTLDTSAIKGIMVSDDRMEVEGGVDLPGAWVVSNDTVTSTGDPFLGRPDRTKCGPDVGFRECEKWIASLNLRQEIAYQPANRFWPLQWIETAILLVLSGGLAGFCFWWIRRKMS